MLLAMLGFAFVWLAQLPFGLVAAVVGPPPRRVRPGLPGLGGVELLRLGGVFLFVCVAVLIVMALARPLRNNWWFPARAVSRRARPAVHVRRALPDPGPEAAARQRELARAQAKQLAPQQGVSDIPVRVEDVDEFTDEPNAFAIGLGPTRARDPLEHAAGKPFSDPRCAS